MLASIVAWVAFWWDSFLHSGFPVLFFIRPRWTLSSMPDQTDKVVLITGGNSGTGYATAKAFYERGAKVYIACRSEERARQAIADIYAGGETTLAGKFVYTPLAKNIKVGTVEYINLDLTDLESVERCAEAFVSREKRLDVLFANAGVMATPPGEYTKQGYSLQFGTNVLGHHRLISLLLPIMLETSRLHPSTPSRLITVASLGHASAPRDGVNYASLVRGGPELNKWVEYGQSKWGDIALAKWVHWHYGPGSPGAAADGEIISVSLHPGLIATNLYNHLSSASLLVYIPWMLRVINVPSSVGAINQIWAGACPTEEARTLSGGYIVPYHRIGTPRPDLNNKRLVDRLWEWCAAQVHRTD